MEQGASAVAGEPAPASAPPQPDDVQKVTFEQQPTSSGQSRPATSSGPTTAATPSSPSAAAAAAAGQGGTISVTLPTAAPGQDVDLDALRTVCAPLAAPDGSLPVGAVPALLGQLSLCPTPEQLQGALQHLGSNSGRLSMEDVSVLLQLIQGPHTPGAGAESSFLSYASGNVGSHRAGTQNIAALKRSLSRARAAYMGTGQLTADDVVLAYMRRLDDHRKVCELTGRYREADVTAQRIADLKVAQAGRLKAELVAQQRGELEHLQAAYSEDTARFDAEWRVRVAEYESNLTTQLAALKDSHSQQLAAFREAAAAARPQRPQLSADYLDNRVVEERLVKQGQYRMAHQLKVAGDVMYTQELAATQAAHEGEMAIKEQRLVLKQQTELEVLLQRAARGRDELELKRLDAADKRAARLRNAVAELDGMHRAEVAHLEHFLSAQAAAGKFLNPGQDGGIKRKKDMILSGATRRW